MLHSSPCHHVHGFQDATNEETSRRRTHDPMQLHLGATEGSRVLLLTAAVNHETSISGHCARSLSTSIVDFVGHLLI